MDTYEHLKESLSLLEKNIKEKIDQEMEHREHDPNDYRFEAPEDMFCCEKAFLHPTFTAYCRDCDLFECEEHACPDNDVEGTIGDLGGVRI